MNGIELPSFSVRSVAIAISACLVLYIATHLLLSRISQGMVQRDWGIPRAFIYVPLRPDTVADHERPLIFVHQGLSAVFYPIWKVDHGFFGGPRPMHSMPLRSLSR